MALYLTDKSEQIFFFFFFLQNQQQCLHKNWKIICKCNFVFLAHQTRARTHTSAPARTRARTHKQTNKHTHTRTHAYTHTHTHIHSHTQTHTHIHTHVRTHARTHTHAHTHTHTHTHTQTNKQTSIPEEYGVESINHSPLIQLDERSLASCVWVRFPEWFPALYAWTA